LGISASAEFLQHLVFLRRQMILTAILIIFLALIVALIFSSSLAKPLHRLTLFAKDIGRGKSKIPNPGSKTDEISLLYNTMIEMQQKIQKREKENKQIVASVAHELRNPIAGMQINSELLLEKVSSKEKKYSMAIYQELKKMANIVDSFLNYSRPIDANMESSDLVDLLEEILSTNSFDQTREQIKISGNAVVDIHKSKMKHVFTNLIRNALEAGEKGGVVEILIQEIKPVTQITIKNSGKPIDSKNRSQIFEAFFSTKENGVGLGLPIAKSIVEQHGGELFLEKSDESGTFFVIILPGQKNEVNFYEK
jgi:signal transduction histidine kinase